MIETGAGSPYQSVADSKIGRRGEISRYQILPNVWKEHTQLDVANASNPNWSSIVAMNILNKRVIQFQRLYNANPTPEITYALWNAPAYVIGDKRNKRMPRVINDRMNRFGALYRSLLEMKKKK